MQAVYEAHQGALDHTRVVLGKQLGDPAVLFILDAPGRSPRFSAERAQLNFVLTFYLDLMVPIRGRDCTPRGEIAAFLLFERRYAFVQRSTYYY